MILKLVSWNVNGIRAVHKKGELKKFVDSCKADILLFQETKSTEQQVRNIIEEFSEYTQYYHSAEKPGYAGTSIWVKKKRAIREGNNHFKGVSFVKDNEGRVLQLDIEKLSIFCVYFPNGGKSPAAWKGKLVFYDEFLQGINALRKKGRHIIWAGDINCAHNEIDLARPKENDGEIGFHPDERKWLDNVEKNGWVDAFRKKYSTEVVYSYWHMISNARSRNVGWRIDYFFVDTTMMKNVKKIEYLTNQMGSDHCPVVMEISL